MGYRSYDPCHRYCSCHYPADHLAGSDLKVKEKEENRDYVIPSFVDDFSVYNKLDKTQIFRHPRSIKATSENKWIDTRSNSFKYSYLDRENDPDRVSGPSDLCVTCKGNERLVTENEWIKVFPIDPFKPAKKESASKKSEGTKCDESKNDENDEKRKYEITFLKKFNIFKKMYCIIIFNVLQLNCWRDPVM